MGNKGGSEKRIRVFCLGMGKVHVDSYQMLNSKNKILYSCAVEVIYSRYNVGQCPALFIDLDGRKTAYEYDAFGNRTKETVTNINDAGATGGSPKAYGVYVYEYPAGSNRLSRILFNGQPQETYTYDNAGRITQRVHSTVGTTI